jgi:hypothetical protein
MDSFIKEGRESIVIAKINYFRKPQTIFAWRPLKTSIPIILPGWAGR